MKLTKMADARYLLEQPGFSPVVLVRADVEQIASQLPLNVTEVIRTSSGIEGVLMSGGQVHLCFSDEAEDFANAILQASGFDYTEGKIRA